MTKSSKTYELEEAITLATWKIGTVACPEVGLGDAGIVDFITMELGKSKTVRCYELKISKSDFLSDAKKTFIGDLNYYVIPSELWGTVKNYIEPGIGCVCVDSKGRTEVKKKPTRQTCALPKKYIAGRILQSLYREHMKHVENDWKLRHSSDPAYDMKRAIVEEGDVVEYNGKLWIIDKIEYRKEGSAMFPVCTIIGKNKTTATVRPSMLKKKIREK